MQRQSLVLLKKDGWTIFFKDKDKENGGLIITMISKYYDEELSISNKELTRFQEELFLLEYMILDENGDWVMLYPCKEEDDD